jgi:hypothetical protein
MDRNADAESDRVHLRSNRAWDRGNDRMLAARTPRIAR